MVADEMAKRAHAEKALAESDMKVRRILKSCSAIKFAHFSGGRFGDRSVCPENLGDHLHPFHAKQTPASSLASRSRGQCRRPWRWW